MEDSSGLELSLGLSCGGSSGKSKVKNTSADPKIGEGSSNGIAGGSTTASDSSFKNFFQTISENQGQKGKQLQTAPDLPKQENFWIDLGNNSAPVIDHINVNDVGQNNSSQFNLWASTNKTASSNEENSNKRKMSCDEINFQSKREKVVDSVDLHNKKPHVLVTTTGDASSGVNNEDVESEGTEGSNSWLVSQLEEKSKISGMHTKLTDGKHILNDANGIVLPPGDKESSVLGNDSKHKLGKVAYGIPMSFEPATAVTVPFAMSVKGLPAANAPNSNSEHSGIQAMSTSNLQLSFGYSPVQLPTLETGSSLLFNSQPWNVTSSVIRDGASNKEHSDDLQTSLVSVQAPHNSSPGTVYEGKSSDLVKCNRKHVVEAGSSSSQNEDKSKGIFNIFRQREIMNETVGEGITREGPAIKPGIVSDVKFGGSGSYPDLPWFSTTGPGPNGRVISGVAYKYNQNEVKIVCACHGTHMSQEEFVQHASGETVVPQNNTILSSVASSNPAASGKS